MTEKIKLHFVRKYFYVCPKMQSFVMRRFRIIIVEHRSFCSCASSPQNLAVPNNFYSAISVSLWNDLAHPLFYGVRLTCFKSRVNAFIDSSCSLPFCLLMFSLSFFSFHRLVLWGWDLLTDRV